MNQKRRRKDVGLVSLSQEHYFLAHVATFLPRCLSVFVARLSYIGPQVPWERTLLVCLAVGIWAFRLTYNWIIGWTGLNHEDWRYLQMRKDITKGESQS